MTVNIWRISYLVRLLKVPEYGRAFLIILLSMLAIGNSAYAAGDYQSYSPRIIINSKWGPGTSEFGLIEGLELQTQGPSTFTLDKRGNIYIFDAVKETIKKFSNEGTYLATLGSNIVGSAMAVDDQDHIFVLRDHSFIVGGNFILHEYSSAGELIKDHEISKDIKFAEMIMIDDSGDLFVNRDHKVYKIGVKTRQTDNAEGSTLSDLDKGQQSASKKYGMQGKTKETRFIAKGKNEREAILQVLSSDGALIKEISVVAGSFLGQDDQGSIYIQGGSTKDESTCEVRKYDLEGTVAAVVELPQCYGSYTTINKSLELDNYGNIYQMLTTSNGVQLIKWQQQ